MVKGGTSSYALLFLGLCSKILDLVKKKKLVLM